MNASNTSPPAHAPAHAARQPVQQARTDRSAEPPRQQAETRSAKDRFAAKLERETSGTGGERKDSTDFSALEGAFAGKARLPNGSSEGEANSGGHEGFAQTAMTFTAQSTSAALIAAPAAVSIDPTSLQRMAAQIAESWPSSAAQQMSIQFPEGMLAESALIRREPDGSVAIRIAGMDPTLSARQSARAQIELTNALALRRLRVDALSFERAEADQRGLDSAISRAV